MADLVPFVPSSKQKNGVREEQRRAEEIVFEKAGYQHGAFEEGKVLPQVMGGGLIETGGDGTGWGGGITLNTWEYWFSHFDEFRALFLNGEPVEGEDYPTQEQMELARKFARSRESF